MQLTRGGFRSQIYSTARETHDPPRHGSRCTTTSVIAPDARRKRLVSIAGPVVTATIRAPALSNPLSSIPPPTLKVNGKSLIGTPPTSCAAALTRIVSPTATVSRVALSWIELTIGITRTVDVPLTRRAVAVTCAVPGLMPRINVRARGNESSGGGGGRGSNFATAWSEIDQRASRMGS